MAADIAPTRGRCCDICQSHRRAVVYEQRFVSFDHDAGLLTGYDVAVCGGCGFVYADGLPEPLVFERYYREMSKHGPAFDATRPVPSYRTHNIDLIASQVVKRLPDRSARILDVGVGNGDILLALREFGYRNLTGLDPSPRTAEIVESRHKLRVLNTPVSQLTSCTEKFDVILLSGVLEHFRDLRPTLLLLKTLLDKNGCMCVAVPDAARFAECVESPYQYFSVEHINFFTMRSLQSLFACVGMNLRSSCWESTALLGVLKEPIIHGIFETGAIALPPMRDPNGSEQIGRYVAYSRLRQDVLMARIQEFLTSGDGIVIWGAGSLTMHLLSDPRFSLLNVVAFVDANANYWDKTIRGVPVISPASVAAYRETILIVSYSYEDEICSEIRTLYQLNNKIVRLFGVERV
ncbi:MAG TPA: class I SAM-dependent methyltransferase [Steroidobacteraceae bacterium]|nr:class I SAM-dependent methyltransferase [Steroidobacteraceae bacterium]